MARLDLLVATMLLRPRLLQQAHPQLATDARAERGLASVRVTGEVVVDDDLNGFAVMPPPHGVLPIPAPVLDEQPLDLVLKLGQRRDSTQEVAVVQRALNKRPATC